MAILAAIVFSSFIGGDKLEFAGQVSFDSAGNVIVIGSTQSTNFPMIPGTAPKAVDAYIVRLSPDRSRVVWGRFLGGSGLEDTLSLAVDADDNIYISGRTDSLDFPVTSNAPQKKFGGGAFDGYVAKLSSDGDVVFATYFGGSGADAPDGIAVDGGGNIVIGGDTSSVDYPVLHPYQSTNRGGTDLFVTRFAPDGTVVYSTFIGSTVSDAGHAIAVDAAGNAWFTGAARAADFPVLNAQQAQYGGGAGDAVLVGFAPDGALVTSTFLGGSGFDGGDAVQIAPDGAIWIAGRSESFDFPLRNPMQTLAGRYDTFVAKLDRTGREVLNATFIGGADSDFPLDMVIGPGGRPIVCGETASMNFPMRGPVQQSHAGGFYDAYVTMIEADGSAIAFSTYLGGEGMENCSSVSLSRQNHIAMSGATTSSNFPLVRPLRSVSEGGEDYVAVLDLETVGTPRRRAVAPGIVHSAPPVIH